jgi:hypothetical protein
MEQSSSSETKSVSVNIHLNFKETAVFITAFTTARHWLTLSTMNWVHSHLPCLRNMCGNVITPFSRDFFRLDLPT